MEGDMGGILSEHSSQMSRVVAPLGCRRFFPLDSMKRVLYTKTTSEGEFFFFTSEISRLPALIYSPFVCVCACALGRNSSYTTT